MTTLDFESYREAVEESLFSHLRANPGAAAALTLEPYHFSTPGRAALFGILQDLARRKIAFDKRVLKQEIERRGLAVEADWPQLFDHAAGGSVGDLGVIEQYALYLRDHAVRRRLLAYLREAVDAPRDLKRPLDQILQSHATTLAAVQEELTDDVDPSAAGIYKRSLVANPHPYFPSGLKAVDRNVKGLRPGHLWVLSAGYKSRKTTTALNIVAAQLRAGKHVMYIALEDDDQAFFDKLVAIWAGVKADYCEPGAWVPNEEIGERVRLAREELAKLGLRIYDARKGVHNWKNLPALIAGDKLRFGQLDLVVVDYVQAYSTSYEVLQEIVPLLLRVTSEQKVALLALSQMNNTDIREGARGAGDGILRAKGTGDLGAACHVGIEIVRQEDVDDEVCLYVKVARHGRPQKTFSKFDPEIGRFFDNDTTTISMHEVAPPDVPVAM